MSNMRPRHLHYFGSDDFYHNLVDSLTPVVENLTKAHPELGDAAKKLLDADKIAFVHEQFLTAKYKDQHQTGIVSDEEVRTNHLFLHGEWVKVKPEEKQQSDRLEEAKHIAESTLGRAISAVIGKDHGLKETLQSRATDNKVDLDVIKSAISSALLRSVDKERQAHHATDAATPAVMSLRTTQTAKS
jgi:RNA-binding protein YhbY